VTRRGRAYQVLLICECGWFLDATHAVVGRVNQPFGIIDTALLHAWLEHRDPTSIAAIHVERRCVFTSADEHRA
jgi:hypothetical protein